MSNVISLPSGFIRDARTCAIRPVPFSIVFMNVPHGVISWANEIEEMEFETESEAIAYAEKTARDMGRSNGSIRPDFVVI